MDSPLLGHLHSYTACLACWQDKQLKVMHLNT